MPSTPSIRSVHDYKLFVVSKDTRRVMSDNFLTSIFTFLQKADTTEAMKREETRFH